MLENKFTYWFISLIVIISICEIKSQNQLKELDLYNVELVRFDQDWLVDPVNQKTGLFRTQKGELIISNGLISRKFSLEPDGATIGFQNLMNGESLLRSIRAEAELVINNEKITIGGLTGQPIHNYLLEEWIPDLKPDSGSFHLVDVKWGKTKERFPWQKRPEWMSRDLPWPAPGTSLIFTYKGNDKWVDFTLNKKTSDQGRSVIISESFDEINPEWELFISKSNTRNSIENEGKPGEIMAESNHAVFAELPNPKNAKVWLLNIDPGTDNSTEWGPGIVLLDDSKTVVKFNINTNENSFGIFDGNQYWTKGKYEKGESITLRVEQTKDFFVLSWLSAEGVCKVIEKISITSDVDISRVRVGKTDPKGGNSDKAIGERGRLRLNRFQILGEYKEGTVDEIRNKLMKLKEIQVQVHYEMYDGIPLMSKWITVNNDTDESITINTFKSEILACVEPESSVDAKKNWMLPNITVESDYRFGGMSNDNLFESSVSWEVDPLYSTQVNYNKKAPVLLVASPRWGPDKIVDAGESFESYRIWELIHSSRDRERKGLAQRRMYRSQAPWVTENPILMHVRSADTESVKKAIDQSAEVGFEMVIMTFGSGFSMEDTSAENITRMKELADYAHSKGIALGGYSLLASRSIGKENDVVMPEGMKPRFGHSPCLGSKWGQNYFRTLYQFYEKTGHDILEHDGSYPGDVCASEGHPGHRGLMDSQWEQFEMIKNYYEWCRERGIYLNVPDFYFMAGSNKTGMGYRETNWSLPRAQQEIIERQNIYDGTWEKTPSMGWMFVPLVQYHGGGEAATIEPLKHHLSHYEQRLANLFGAGVQACYRGPQLFDSPKTKRVVKKWVDFYKVHRDILDSDIVHIRRPDGRDFDGFMHVNPTGDKKGLIMLYNPLAEDLKKDIPINVYYTGLKSKVRATSQSGEQLELSIDRHYQIHLPVSIPAKGWQWFVLK